MNPEIEVEITRFVDDSQPGFIELRFVDAFGHEHFFIEKVPVVTLEYLNADSIYPRQGFIACRIVEKKLIDNREVFRVNTEEPWGIESTAGETEFDVFREQLLEHNNG
jgi:hypothetical protein